MDLLKLLHDWSRNGLPFMLFFVQWVWSLSFLWRPVWVGGFMFLSRILFFLVGILAVSGIGLAFMGLHVPIATVGARPDLSVVCNRSSTLDCLPWDPSRQWEHLMYGAFLVLSSVAVEALYRGTLMEKRQGLRWIPLATLFAFGCAVRVGQVAYLPGATPGT